MWQGQNLSGFSNLRVGILTTALDPRMETFDTISKWVGIFPYRT